MWCSSIYQAGPLSSAFVFICSWRRPAFPPFLPVWQQIRQPQAADCWIPWSSVGQVLDRLQDVVVVGSFYGNSGELEQHAAAVAMAPKYTRRGTTAHGPADFAWPARRDAR